MRDRLSIVRASHLFSYMAVMRRVGIPVDRDLACSRLPPRIEENPDLFVSLPFALQWIAECGRDVPPMHLGFLASQETSLSMLKASHIGAIMAAPTCFKRLQVVAALAHREDSALRLNMQPEVEGVRIFCEFAQLYRHPFLCLADWLAVQAVVSIVRSLAGPRWCPAEITFVSKFPLPTAARDAFGTTRVRVGQTRTSVLIQNEALAGPGGHQSVDNNAGRKALQLQDLEIDPWSFVTLLRSAIQPYLSDGHPDLALAAEIAGMSKRTLQRKLQLSGHSYSEILQDARCTLAKALLDDSCAKIIDVAMASGYETPQHFSRAFRRFTGLAPTAYRRVAVPGE